MPSWSLEDDRLVGAISSNGGAAAPSLVSSLVHLAVAREVASLGGLTQQADDGTLGHFYNEI